MKSIVDRLARLEAKVVPPALGPEEIVVQFIAPSGEVSSSFVLIRNATGSYDERRKDQGTPQ